MVNEKINSYINEIHAIMNNQLDLIYRHHTHEYVDGYADDFPFFNLFVHLKKNLYEVLVNDLYKKGYDMTDLLEELNGLPEFKEMGITIKESADGLIFPPISTFAANLKRRKYKYYLFELFPYNRYVLGLEYILFKFAPTMIETLYAEFATVDGEWSASIRDYREKIAEKYGNHSPEEYFVSDDNCLNDDFKYVGYYNDIVFTEEDMTDEDGNEREIPIEIQWKRFREQVHYYYYCCYRRYPCNEIEPHLHDAYKVLNLWDINTERTYGCCLAKNIGTENEEYFDLIAPVPYLGENLVRAFHEVKAGGVEEVAGIDSTPGLHFTERYRNEVLSLREAYLDEGYTDVTNHPDFLNRTNDGVDFYDLDAINENKENYWGVNFTLGNKNNENKFVKFLNIQHYTDQILYLQWENKLENDKIKEAKRNNESFELVGKRVLMETYKLFLSRVLSIIVTEPKGLFNDATLIEETVRKTYYGMHKSLVWQLLHTYTSIKDATITKSNIQKELDLKGAKTRTKLMSRYHEEAFNNEQITKISQLIGYDILKRID